VPVVWSGYAHLPPCMHRDVASRLGDRLRPQSWDGMARRPCGASHPTPIRSARCATAAEVSSDAAARSYLSGAGVAALTRMANIAAAVLVTG
jgi:hypothetical protein